MFVTYDKIVRVLLCGCVSVVPAVVLHLLGLCSCCMAFLTAWAASAAIYLVMASLKVEVTGKAVLVTGCDTGFGHALALHLHKLGFRVFAGCLQDSSEGAQFLRKVGSSRLHVLLMDITNQDHLAKSLKEIKSALSPTEVLWGLVNNAAVETYGAIEWVTLDTYRNICTVNVFGTIAVTKTFLPLIRQAKGRVVTVGSVRGRLPSPLGSPYDITKYAIEAFNDDLRNEMRRFGVGVCLVEPGNFTAGTNILRKEDVLHYERKMWDAMDEEVREAYGKDYYDHAAEDRLKATTCGAHVCCRRGAEPGSTRVTNHHLPRLADCRSDRKWNARGCEEAGQRQRLIQPSPKPCDYVVLGTKRQQVILRTKPHYPIERRCIAI